MEDVLTLSVLEEELKKTEETFDTLTKKEAQLKEQGNQLNQQLGKVKAEQFRLQGEYRQLKNMLDRYSPKKKVVRMDEAPSDNSKSAKVNTSPKPN